MPRGQKKGWKELRGVPKGPTAKPVRVAVGIWKDGLRFHVYRYTGGKSRFLGSFEDFSDAILARDGGAPAAKAARKTGGDSVEAYFCSTFLRIDHAERKPSTIRAMKSRFNAHLADTIGHRALADVTFEDLTQLAASLVKKTGGKTRRETLLLVRGIFASAAVRGKIPTNPAEHLKVPPAGRTPVEIPPLADANALIAEIAHPVARMAAQTMLHTGMRIGECLALTWEDVDLTKKRITVRKSVDHCTRELITPKTKAATRTIAMTPGLFDAFGAYARTATPKKKAWVFPACDAGRSVGDALAYEDFMRLHWNPARVAAKVDLHPHMLRHIYASMLLKKRTPITTTAKLLGHASAQVTLGIYGHCMDDEDEIASYVAAAFA